MATYYLKLSESPAGALLAFAAGYGSHMLADMLNRSGVGLLYPLSFERYGLGKIRTGSLAENALSVLLAAAVLMAIIADERILP